MIKNDVYLHNKEKQATDSCLVTKSIQFLQKHPQNNTLKKANCVSIGNKVFNV